MKRRSMIAAAAGASGIAATAVPRAEAYSRKSPLSHPLNVRDFGAAGDGKTDDSAAIQAALDRAGSGGQVYFPDGQYLVTKGVVSQTDNVTITGESWNAELIRAPSNSGGLLTVYGHGTLVTGLTLNGNGTAGNAEYAELSLSGAYGTAERLQVLNSSRTGIDASANHCTVRGCTVIGLGNSGIQSYGIWAVNYSVGIMIRDNYITGTGIDGIGISGTGYQVIGNFLEDCHHYTGEGGGQLVVYNDQGTTRNGLILGNTIGPGRAVFSSGMELNGTDTTVTGNVIFGQKFLGMVGTGDGWLFSGNTIKNSGQGGTTIGTAIWLNPGATGFQITGNRLFDDQPKPTQAYGVVVNDGDSNFYGITGNQITGNVQEPIRDGGTGLNKVIRDNVGIDDAIPVIGASHALELPLNPVFSLSGSASVTSVSGPAWSGRTITILPNQALSFYAGGNIANNLTVPADTPVTGIYSGGRWFFK